MSEHFATNSLIAKRTEVAGEIAAAVARVAQLRAELVHLDVAICIRGRIAGRS